MATQWKRDETNSTLIIIPTMGNPSLILPAVQRVVMHSGSESFHLCIVANPQWEHRDAVAAAERQCRVIVEATNALRENKIHLTWEQMPGPAGWVGAVNQGVEVVSQRTGLPEHIVVMNDDLLVTAGWTDRLRAAFETENVHLRIELVTHGQRYLEGDGHSAKAYGKIGMVGPVSANVAGAQNLQPPSARVPSGALFEIDPAQALDDFAVQNADQNDGVVLSADFLSGFCTMYTRDCFIALCEDSDDGLLLDPTYRIGGFDDNDVSARASILGYRLGIAVDCYVHHLGHRTLDKVYPSQARGLANAPHFLKKWMPRTKRDQRLVAVYRVGFSTSWDITMFRTSLERTAELVDGIAVLVTNNPNDIHRHSSFRLGELGPDEAELVASTGPDYPDKKSPIEKWLKTVVDTEKVDLAVEFRDSEKHEWDERDERNQAIELAESLSPDWMISIDHDEIVEDRVTRESLARLMRHPNPLVQSYDIGFLTHWDTPRLHRTDRPYANGYSSNMRGFRMWRFNAASPARIQTGTRKGLHCGNVPPFSETSQRVSGIRMRHFGYLRGSDRLRKFKRYAAWMDPNPNDRLTGGGYGHILCEEGMEINAYSPRNGIVFSMLMHSGERSWDLYRHLDTLYGLVDKIILVWTDSAEIPDDIRTIADAFECKWVHSPFEESSSLAKCRNAAIDLAHEEGVQSLRWMLTFDPDEHLAAPVNDVIALRRMAEVTDSLGWMMQFRNHRSDGQFNMSETVRMFTLDDQRVMRYSGRVHERLEDAMKELGSRGIHPKIRSSPFIINHYGLAKSDQQMQDKLERYTTLLHAAIKENPYECGHWTSLGLQYANDGEAQKFEECMRIARECSGSAYLPWKVSGQHALRQARKYFEHCVQSLVPSHPYARDLTRIVEWLRENAPDMPVSGHARTGAASPPKIDLDELLDRYNNGSEQE